jgi:uncharacterized protein (TIGR02145 family)
MRSFLFVGFILFFGYSYTQTTGTITDSRDGKVYKTVVIGNQTWMAENLNVESFRNGDPIPEAKTNEEWIKAGKEGKPAWCYYKNKKKNGKKYGKLYNYFAVSDSRGLAMSGWHIPSDDEWKIIKNNLGDDAGKKMKTSYGWFSNGNGNNESGFSGLPGGNRDIVGPFFYYKKNCYWWSSTQNIDSRINNEHVWHHDLSFKSLNLNRYNDDKRAGFSVRCIKD